MAIQKTFEHKGVTVTSAYWFLRQIVYREGLGLIVELCAYADQAKRQEDVNENVIAYRNFSGIPYGKSGNEKMEVTAYNYIKGTPEFIGSTDI